MKAGGMHAWGRVLLPTKGGGWRDGEKEREREVEGGKEGGGKWQKGGRGKNTGAAPPSESASGRRNTETKSERWSKASEA